MNKGLAGFFLSIIISFKSLVMADQVTIQFPQGIDDDVIHKSFVRGIRDFKDIDYQHRKIVVDFDGSVTDVRTLKSDLKKALGYDVGLESKEEAAPVQSAVISSNQKTKKDWVQPKREK